MLLKTRRSVKYFDKTKQMNLLIEVEKLLKTNNKGIKLTI